MAKDLGERGRFFQSKGLGLESSLYGGREDRNAEFKKIGIRIEAGDGSKKGVHGAWLRGRVLGPCPFSFYGSGGNL
jgi:hypothetical protein